MVWNTMPRYRGRAVRWSVNREVMGRYTMSGGQYARREGVGRGRQLWINDRLLIALCCPVM